MIILRFALPTGFLAGLLTVLLTLIVAATLSACVTATPSSYPIQSIATAGTPANHYVLPPAEVTAVVNVALSGQRSSYLLALRSDENSVDLALLTPQGGPLYQLSSRQGEQTLTRKLASGKEPDGHHLLMQLQLIYGTEPALRAVLAQGWTLQQEVHGRTYLHTESLREIVINYAGEPPWFPRAQLIDSLHGIILTVRIQEQSDVLPE